MKRVLVIAFLLVATSCARPHALSPGRYEFSTEAHKRGRDRPYTWTIECVLSVSDPAILMGGVEESGHEVCFRGAQRNGKIQFETVLPKGSVMQAMQMRNLFTGTVMSSGSASGDLVGTAGPNVYLTGSWTLTTKEKTSNNMPGHAP